VNVVHTIDEVRAALQPHRRGKTIALVPTMGAFHGGHIALFRAARESADVVVASLFVNAAQFEDPADLDGYPRDEARDADVARDAGVDLLFVPETEEVYPPGFQTWVDVEQLGAALEGAHRPGHFRAVATVCLKLFNIVRPELVFFGQKDAQQVAVVRRMVRDLNVDVDVRVVPTVRDEDGLALSSRNARLTPDQRARALALPRALATKDAARARELLRDLDVDYVEIADFEPRVLAAAVRVGDIRLIDNVVLENPCQDGDSSPGCDGRVRCKDAGSARIRSDTGATEDAAARRPARPGGIAPRSDTGSKKGADQ
jgi:pantoate--beta-alanine ligase